MHTNLQKYISGVSGLQLDDPKTTTKAHSSKQYSNNGVFANNTYCGFS